MLSQGLQVVGSLLILAAYAALQRGMLSIGSRLYQALNVIGAGLLAVLAAHERQFGFLLLESSWASIAAYGMVRDWHRRRRGSVPAPR